MIIIPEIETILITPPRTGSTSLLHAAREVYPLTMSLYRHMEADGVPQGYDRWRRIGVVRHPIERLWSMYKYCSDRNLADGGWRGVMYDSVQVPWEEWLLRGLVPFTHPYWHSGGIDFNPRYHVRHPLPEQRKSQFIYVRPDLGTEIVKLEDGGLVRLGRILGLTDYLYHRNGTRRECMPRLSIDAIEHAHHHFAWELSLGYELEEVIDPVRDVSQSA